MGRRSPSPVTGVTFAMGEMYESFHNVGKEPEENEALNMSVTGVASSGANFFQIRFGTSSGPMALKGLMLSKFLHTSDGLITGSSS